MRMGTFLFGAIVGAAAASLMTPRTGRDTQETLKRRADEFKNQYGDVIEQGRLRATELIQSGKEMLDERLSQTQQEKGQQDVQPRVHETAERPQEMNQEQR